ncbi:MAG: tripartite tricarboxylate transporter substrate binding protein [Hyphomicrobiales bacterium]|nr:tripartite tricarboxylate transporter substrate binding protein [Hyphomicrobiales bacterium]MBV9429956.1 tripartite tricarboxylate transporter substrate binding protein [Bradyrhizobiaceae bacterium]
MRRFVAAALAAVLGASAAQAAWPERPVQVLVPFAAGGITDVIARVVAERLQTSFKQPFVVDNEPGAAGIIAAQRLARATPDGYTLMSAPVFQITIAPFTHKVDFDPMKDFTPITILATSPFVIAVRADLPVNTLSEFIAYVKAKPGKLNYGSAGPGSFTQIVAVMFLKSAGLDMVHVPYKGIAPAFTDLLAGHIDMMAATPVETKGYVGSDKVKFLAVTGAQRSPQLPGVPTVSETLPSPATETTHGILAPAKTPPDIVNAIAGEIAAAEKSAEFRERLQRVGVEPALKTSAEFADIIATDTSRWRDVVHDLGLKVQ